MRCHMGPVTLAGFFHAASCTLFSPTILSPASHASFTTSAPCVFVTATISTADGSRPTRTQAAAILCSTSPKTSLNSLIFAPLCVLWG